MWRHARGAEPTVNHELGRRDVFRLVGREKEHGVRHVPAIAHPSHGHLPMARRDQRFGIYQWGWGFSTNQDFNGDIALIACFAASWSPGP